MKKILFAIMLLTTFAQAQLHNRFFSNGNAARIAALGAYGGVTYLQWKQMQPTPTPTYNWSFSDAMVQSYQSAGVKMMLTLSCTHPVDAAYSTPGTCANTFSVGGTDNNANWPVVGNDTTLWKNFLNAMVDRYDLDGSNDMPGLTVAVKNWHIIGQEWNRVWCDVPYADTSFQYAKDFVKLVNMTYNTIKAKQPTSTISYAGIDVRFQAQAFIDGYFPATQTTICNNILNCSSTSNSTAAQMAAAPKFSSSRRNVMHIFKNALSDEVDIHQYGRWKNTPDFVKWAKDSTFGKPIIFMEGGGPFCPACENIYHNATDTDGQLPAPLVRDNASYVVYYFITGLAADVKKLHWNLPNEYLVWGATWGDLDLMSKNDIRKPSFHVYRFLAQSVFSNSSADTVVKVVESNPALYHYMVNPMGLNVAWSTNASDNIVVTGTGQLYRWDIPTTCTSIYPSSTNLCDSIIQQTSINVNGSYTIQLNNGVPVFYSWGNVISVPDNIITDNYSVKVFPNPFTSQTTIQTDKYLTDAVLTVENIFGQAVRTVENISGQSVVFNRGELAAGLYFIRLKQNNKLIAVKKIVIAE